MPWITFTRDFDFRPAHFKGHVTVAYPQGFTSMVTRECAKKAIAAGAAKPAKNPEKRHEGRKPD